MCHSGPKAIERFNLNRCTEDTYLEVKFAKERWEVDKYVEDKPAYQGSVRALNTILQVLELKFDEDEDVQEQKQKIMAAFR